MLRTKRHACTSYHGFAANLIPTILIAQETDSSNTGLIAVKLMSPSIAVRRLHEVLATDREGMGGLAVIVIE